MPAASIVMPVYNAEAYISVALTSVLSQTFQDFECIIIDDGSTDNTAAVIKSFGDNRLRYYSITNSGGPARPRNIGMQYALGDYIFLFDADDVMHPKKLELSLNAFMLYPEANFLFTNFSSIDERGNLLKNNYLDEYDSLWFLLQKGKKTSVQLMQSQVLYTALIKVNFIGASSVALRKSALSPSDLFNEHLKNSDDRLFFIFFSKRNDGVFINQCLHFYRVNEKGISNRDFSERGISKIEALKIIKNDCQDEDLKKNLDCQIAKDFASIAYDYKTKKEFYQQLKNAIKSFDFKGNWWALKLIAHAVFSIVKQELLRKMHSGK
jgi:glycosyltransferase involved in cell wall biosynthesis